MADRLTGLDESGRRWVVGGLSCARARADGVGRPRPPVTLRRLRAAAWCDRLAEEKLGSGGRVTRNKRPIFRRRSGLGRGRWLASARRRSSRFPRRAGEGGPVRLRAGGGHSRRLKGGPGSGSAQTARRMPRGQRAPPRLPKGVPGPLRGEECQAADGVSVGGARALGATAGLLTSEGPARVRAEDPRGSAVVPVRLASEGPATARRELTRRDDAGLSASSSAGVPGAVGTTGQDKRRAVIDMLSTVEGREAAAEALEEGMFASTTRASKEVKANTMLTFAAAAGIELYPLSVEKLSPILGAMKLAGYRSTNSYLSEVRLRHVQLLHPITDQLRAFFKDAVRSVVRGRGPVRRAPVVRLEVLVELQVPSRWARQTAVAGGPAAPWDAFVVSCWWMLRGAEAVAIQACQCTVTEGHGAMAEIRLGATKTDIEGVGRRRCFLCICAKAGFKDALCPVCALTRLLEGRCVAREEPGGASPLLVDPRGCRVGHAGLCKVWKMMLASAPKLGDDGDPIGIEVSEHTPRRTGAQFHARRGLALWQIQYLGRWGGSTVEIYVGEAFAELRAGWSHGGGDGTVTKRARQEEREDIQLSEVAAQIRELAPLVKDVRELRREFEARAAGGGGWAKALCDKEAEFTDLAEEAVQEGTFPVNAGTVVRLQSSEAPVCVVNVRSSKVHAVNLELLAKSDRSKWSAACGWKFREEDAVFSVGPLGGACCTRTACAAKFAGIKRVDEDSEDEEE